MSLSQPQACPGYAFTGSRSRGGRWAASASERGREPGLGPAEGERGRCREPPSCPRYGAWRGAWPEVGGACDGRAQKWAGPWRRRPLPGYGERGAGGAGQRTACARGADRDPAPRPAPCTRPGPARPCAPTSAGTWRAGRGAPRAGPPQVTEKVSAPLHPGCAVPGGGGS